MKSNKNCINYKSENLKFHGLTRLNNDTNYVKLQDNTSSKSGEYYTSNFFDCECNAPSANKISLDQQTVLYKDGFGWTSANGCNIDKDSNLRNSRNLTNERCINQLFERPYKTVPYMGSGGGDTCKENQLLPGQLTNYGKMCNNLSDTETNRWIPQIPYIKNNIQNPNNLIQENSDKKWVRGGNPTRQIIKNIDYYKKCKK